jgi:Reverse transcriptase (RNA-dependent DNA polymerase)
MPFGLTNVMNDVFGDLLDVCVVVYPDDILIYSDDPAKHREHIREVLRHLRKHGLFAKADKCEWHQDSVEFLSYMLLAEGLTMSVDIVQTIQDWPEPWKVKDIQSFLGFANFYRCFIYNYSNITIPLTWLTCKGTPWVFTKEC